MRMGAILSLNVRGHRRLQGGGARGAMPPQRPDKKRKNGPVCSILHYQKKYFPGGMPPDPHNSLIWSNFLALATIGPRQCKRLEPPVIEEFEEIKVEIQRIETGTSRGVSLQYLHFSMLLHVLVYPTSCYMHMERGHTWVILYSQSLF